MNPEETESRDESKLSFSAASSSSSQNSISGLGLGIASGVSSWTGVLFLLSFGVEVVAVLISWLSSFRVILNPN